MKHQGKGWLPCESQSHVGHSIERTCAVAVETPPRKHEGVRPPPLGLHTHRGGGRGSPSDGAAVTSASCPWQRQESMQQERDEPASLPDSSLSLQKRRKGSESTLVRGEEAREAAVPWSQRGPEGSHGPERILADL